MSEVSEISSVLNVPIETQQLTSVFKQYRNDIDIYTEDKAEDKEFYVKLFKRLLEGTDLQINDIYPLGCRRQVIKACEDDLSSDRKRLYMVDGDIYLQYKEEVKIPNLFVLKSYCIENYMICEDAVCHVAYIFKGTKNKEEIHQKIDYQRVMQSICKPLIMLFHHFSIQSECCEIYELLNVNAFMDPKTKEIDINKIQSRIESIKASVIRSGISEEKYNALLEKRIQEFPYSIETMLKIVSGKNYLIPFFQERINSCLSCSIRIPREAWKFNMVDYCDLLRLEDLKQALLTA